MIAQETQFIADMVGLRQRMQESYNDSRTLAHSEQWEQHLKFTVVMIPCLRYLGMDDWVARIFGRMAWSYIRLGEEAKATTLLEFSENYDIWQAAANYYWAAEFAHRGGNDKYGKRCLEKFGIICESRLELNTPPTKGALGQAVEFYRRLVEAEEAGGSFSKESNQSDRGRYHELRARLELEPALFQSASRFYRLAGLERYASCCLGFYHLTCARRANALRKQRESFNNALHMFRETSIFAGEIVRDILIAYCLARVELTYLLELVGDGVAPPGVLPEIEARYATIHEIILGDAQKGDEHSLAILAAQASFGGTRAWEALIGYLETLEGQVVPDDATCYRRIERLLNRIQMFLPSYSFLVTPEDEEE